MKLFFNKLQILPNQASGLHFFMFLRQNLLLPSWFQTHYTAKENLEFLIILSIWQVPPHLDDMVLGIEHRL